MHRAPVPKKKNVTRARCFRFCPNFPPETDKISINYRHHKTVAILDRVRLSPMESRTIINSAVIYARYGDSGAFLPQWRAKYSLQNSGETFHRDPPEPSLARDKQQQTRRGWSAGYRGIK
jgi:hypothetical protein